MGKHQPVGIDPFVSGPLAMLETIGADLADSNPYVAAPLIQGTECIRVAILRDEQGPPPPPEYTEEAVNWEPPPMPAYTAAAIQGELLALKTTPPDKAKGVLANASFNIGRWAGGGYLIAREGKKTIWKVAKSTGAIQALGPANAETIITTNFERGQSKPRTAPQRTQNT